MTLKRVSVSIAAFILVAFGLLGFAEAADSAAPHSGIAPQAEQIFAAACKSLEAENAFSFHAEISFDQVLSGDVKIQFAAAADFAVQRPDQLAIDYQSDLGSKKIWFSGDTLTLLDPPHMVYATLQVPPTIDGMLKSVHEKENLTIPLTDLAVSSPCKIVRDTATYGGFVGVGDVNGVEADHVALSSPKTDVQLWFDRTGKPVPLKMVINYRGLPASPEYIAYLSDWKFPAAIPASRFRPDVPKNFVRIDFLKIKEAKEANP